jgi:uncharacterized membrane protein YqjE
MVRGGKPDGAEGQPSLGDLVALAAKDVSQLLRYEISLAKSELKMDARRIGIAAALAVIGLFVGCLLFVLLCIAFAYGLVALGIWTWAAFLIVAGTCLLLIAVAGLIAFTRVRKVTGMKMTRQTVIDDIGMLRRSGPDGKGASPNGSGPSIAKPAAGDKGAVGAGDKPEISQARS